ncbi:acyl carrier protein [Helicobacter sp. CLO-3]|uniref:acyl carrier protein n=1 Tax=unclassified Helicobacter TaxID=2593540 RepID=UPI0008050899|nr:MULTISPECIES: acyl carrier protein [unclassified Helicobacter]OBV29259.1 acyl carrier protein [Helicobacter sp. CLO-3]OHU84141.1 acyl carrier protein [Helicobacter sp. CLO-3]
MALFDEIKAEIVKQLNVEADKVTPEAEFVKDLNADSLDVVELIMALEEQFNVEIPDEEANKIQKVSDVVTFIENHKK